MWAIGLQETTSSKLIGKHFNAGAYHDVFEVIVITKDHEFINRTNYEEELTYLLIELENRRHTVFESKSGWRLIKFFSLSYDIYENKAARSGAYINPPENIVMQNVDLSIYKIQIINVLCGV